MSFWSRLFRVRHGCGYRPCGKDARDLPAEALLGRVAERRIAGPVAIDLWDPSAGVLDQGSTSSCAGHALAQGLRLAFAADGRQLGPLSPLFLYYNARRADAPASAPTDVGTTMRSVMKQLMHLGVCTEPRWPFAASKINRQPSWLAYREAADQRGLRGYYRCASVDEARVALGLKRPVIIGLHVDDAFLEDDGPTQIDDLSGPEKYGHALLVTGYNRTGQFHVLNSWGTRWRAGGRVLVGEAFLARSHALWALDT